MAEPNTHPFFSSVIDEKILKKNMFAFFMSMNPIEEDSELTFGYYDENRYEGDMHWYPVHNKLFWSIKLNDVLVNGKSLGICKDDKECTMTPDSGTS